MRNCRLFYGKMSVKPISSDPTRHAHTLLSKDCLQALPDRRENVFHHLYKNIGTMYQYVVNKRVIILIFIYIDKKKVYYREGDCQNSSLIVALAFVKFRSTLLNSLIMSQNRICFCLFVFGGISFYKSCKTVLMIVEKLKQKKIPPFHGKEG